jgi:cytochrome c oxidase subunit 1
MYQRTLGKWHFWLTLLGTNVTFFAMLLLGYLGMPRRYATYTFDATIAPLAQVTSLHQIATVGAVFILFGQLIWLWNMLQSYYEGPTVEDGDPWGLKDDGMFSREFQWFEARLTATDGGEPSDDRQRPSDRSGGQGGDETTPNGH